MKSRVKLLALKPFDHPSALGAMALYLFACLALAATAAHGQTRSQVTGSTLTKQTPTAFIQADFGQQTFESQMVKSNATTSVQRYLVGGYAGEHRIMGVFLQSNDSDTKFALNDSRVMTAWNELHLQFRMGYVAPTLFGSISNIKTERADAEEVHILGSGYGAGLTVNVPITEWIVIVGSGKLVKTPEAHDINGADVEIGDRKEIEIGASIDIVPRYIDLLAGYRHQTFDLTIDGEKFAEKQSAPYLGMRLGIYF